MIQLTNIEKRLDSIDILKNINLNINRGEIVQIKGVSGSGKSTLLNIIASLMKPTSGEVNIDGENIALLSDIYSSQYRRDKIGFITQSFYLFDALSVQENLLVPTVISEMNCDEVQQKIDTALKMANIFHKKEQKVATLSGGEKQRTVIARAIVNNPNIILCDEPTANLDRDNALLFIEIIKKFKNSGKTVVIATHDTLFETQNIIDKTILIKDGKI